MNEENVNYPELTDAQSSAGELKDALTQEETVQPQVDVTADKVSISQGNINSVRSQQVTLRQSAVRSLDTGQMDVRLGAVGVANTQTLEVNYGAVGAVKTGSANLKVVSSGAVVADDGVNMEYSTTKTILTRGNVLMDHSLAGATLARKVKMENSDVVFLVAGKVEGDVNPVFGPKESLLFGVAAGVVGGILVLTGHLFKKLYAMSEKALEKDEEN